MKAACAALILLITHWLAAPGIAADGTLVVEAAGEAVGSDLESPRELFERAGADAQRAALEQAVGTFVRGHSIVSNSQLAEDLTYTKVRGRVERVEVLSRERDHKDPNLFKVRIRAWIKPVYPEKEQGIVVKAAVSRESLQVGEELKILVQTSQDSYLYIFVVGADNAVTQLLPNTLVKDNFSRAGEKLLFPPAASEMKLKALLPASVTAEVEEKVKIIATRKPEALLTLGFQEGFSLHDPRTTGMVSDLLKRLVQLDPHDWGEATLVYRVRPAAP